MECTGSSSSSSSEDKSPTNASRDNVFSRVFSRLSVRRKSWSKGRSFRRTRKAFSLDQNALRANLEIKDSQETFFTVLKRRLSRESSLPLIRQTRQESREIYSNFQHEGIYRGILRTLLHPLGTPDQQTGFRPGDLIDHLQEVYNCSRDDHERFLKEEIKNKPKQLLLLVRVVEAKDLVVSAKYKESKPYCSLQLTSFLSKSNRKTKSLPNTPKSTPEASPKNKRKNKPLSPVGKEKLIKTQPAKSVQAPYWNEEFHIKVSELLTDELEINIHVGDGGEKSDKSSSGSLRGFFKRSDSDKMIDNRLGHFVIPIRDIPVEGIDDWYIIHPSGCKTKNLGKCHIQLSLSYVQGSQYLSLFSAEDYHQVSTQFYNYALQKAEAEGKKEICLSEKSRKMLDIFGSANRISTLSQSIMDLTILLDLATTSDLVTDAVLHKALKNVQMTWMAKQVGDEAFAERMPLTDAEISVYRTATRNYISTISSKLDKLPCLFPPSLEHLSILKSRLGIVVDLLEMDLWDSSASPGQDLTDRLTSKLQDDIRKWLQENLNTISAHDFIKDPVIPESEVLIDIIQRLTSHCTPLGVATQFYNSFNIKYYRIILLISENMLVKEVRHQMYEMDRYQLKYNSFPVNISRSSRLSLQLYLAVRKYYDVIKDHLQQRDLFRISFNQYQTWFSNCVVFWLQTFKTECMARVEKALEIDKDVVLVTSLVKFSNSSVDTLSCFSKITEEWRQVDYGIPDLAMMAITKITDMICEATDLYADKIHNMLKRNCYYDCKEKQFDVTDRLCITLNNIEHVRQYLDELPHLLNWQAVADELALRHEDPLVGTQSLKTLRRLVSTTHCDILLKSKYLLREIGNKMKVNIEQSMKNLSVHPEKASSIDNTLYYLSHNLDTLSNRLMSSIYPTMLEDLWHVVLDIFSNHLHVGNSHEYYAYMKMHFRSLSSFFMECGLTEGMVKRGQYQKVSERLELNSLTTEELMLAYYDNIAKDVSTPADYLGSLAVKLGYEEETRENLTIHIKVIRAVALPGLDTTGYSDPYVTINIRPHTLAGSRKTQRTQILYKTLDPTFNTDFMFTDIPKCYLKQKGAVLIFSVYDHDHLTSDDFAGEIAIHLDSIPKLSLNHSVDSVQVVILPLKRPRRPSHGPFQVLTERQSSDKTAKYFVTERLNVISNQRERTDVKKNKASKLCGFLPF